MKPKTVVLALEDGTTPDATLKFEMPLAGKVEPGTELSFEGVPASYTASPYMVVFNVDPDKLHGWTGKNAPASGASQESVGAATDTGRADRQITFLQTAFVKSAANARIFCTCSGEAGCSKPFPTKNA